MEKSIYDYKENTNVVATPNGDIVITMNKAIYVKLLNNIYDASRIQEKEGHKPTAENTRALWKAINKL